MKKILIVAMTLMLCACCLCSCDAMMQEIGKTASVSMLDAVQTELEGAGFDTLERYSEEEIAEFRQELAEEGVTLKGEITGVLEGYYENPETGHWVSQIVIGVSATEDAQTLEQFFNEFCAEEVEQGKAEIVSGGWIVNITVSSLVLADAE